MASYVPNVNPNLFIYFFLVFYYFCSRNCFSSSVVYLRTKWDSEHKWNSYILCHSFLHEISFVNVFIRCWHLPVIFLTDPVVSLAGRSYVSLSGTIFADQILELCCFYRFETRPCVNYSISTNERNLLRYIALMGFLNIWCPNIPPLLFFLLFLFTFSSFFLLVCLFFRCLFCFVLMIT